MRFACWITKVTDTHSEYLILIALPRQQWLSELALVVPCTYIVSLVIYVVTFLDKLIKRIVHKHILRITISLLEKNSVYEAC